MLPVKHVITKEWVSKIMSRRYTLLGVINTATFLQSIPVRHLTSFYRCPYGYTGNYCEVGLSRGVPPGTSKLQMYICTE